MLRVIKTDSLRTRADQFDDALRTKLEMILSFYCLKEKISYKQGLNEVAAPFVYFLKTNIKLATAYNYFQAFIDKFLATFYFDPVIVYLLLKQKISFSLIALFLC